jgi:hypothetical protein
MLLMSDGAGNDIGADAGIAVEQELFKQRTFEFVPQELAAKCRKLIESYHAMYGYVGLPDMLWLSDAREVIEANPDLKRVFKKASKSRGARRANDSFLAIATIVVSLEVLARDFASWGKRFPAAKRRAEKLLGDHPSGQRAWLMDLYLYPPLGIRREFANALAPGAPGAQPTARN